jgi:peptidoglycan/xylan/chitin deacetylase (PgdA/CDA1 family)
MKLGRERNVLTILISAFFTCFICLGFSKNPENSKQEAIANVHKISEYDSSLMTYKEKYKSRHVSLCKTTSIYSKEVFLTFDDGPSINNTLDIIDILNRNGVKATFFVVGQRAEMYPGIVKKVNANGMCISPHTYTHNYSEIYKSTEAYFKDMEKCNNVIKTITNKSNFSYIRMPGGSDNLVSSSETLEKIKMELKKRKIYYVDWNVSSDDALGRNIEAFKLKENVISQSRGVSMAVVLMHDSYYKRTTVDSLQEVISYFKKQGYVFRTFNDLTEEEKQKMIKAEVLNR